MSAKHTKGPLSPSHSEWFQRESLKSALRNIDEISDRLLREIPVGTPFHDLLSKHLGTARRILAES